MFHLQNSILAIKVSLLFDPCADVGVLGRSRIKYSDGAEMTFPRPCPSHMAEPTWLKLSGFVDGMDQKDFFGKIEKQEVQVLGNPVFPPLLYKFTNFPRC